MKAIELIKQKLEGFIRKYYTNELIRGGILFLSIGLLYFLFTLLIEHFLWLNPAGRKWLFWAFIIVEVFLFIRFIVYPLTKLFKFRKGINYDTSSIIIGTHFPEVGDKLLNVLQLERNKEQNELLLASIEQKSAELSPIPFQKAIDFKTNRKYLKYLAIPVVLYLLFSVTTDENIFSGSYQRVVNYDIAYEPPAPFSFVVLNENLQTLENKSYTIKLKTEGNVVPETVMIEYGGQFHLMQSENLGSFSYTFQQPTQSTQFSFHSDRVKSKTYELEVLAVPSVLDFSMNLTYPRHTNKQNETIKSGGNATIPEGTKVEWAVKTKNTKEVLLQTQDTAMAFEGTNDNYKIARQIFRNFDYSISSSNENLKDYERLSFSLNVIRDQYPEIKVESKIDSTLLERILFLGQISDDYGLSKLQLVYYPVGNESEVKRKSIPIGTSNFDQFAVEFPGDIELEPRMSYEYYFEVFDNDAINNFKSTKSQNFHFRKMDADEIEAKQLENQQESIRGLDQSLKDMQQDKEVLDELSRMQKEKSELSYNDRKKLENFLKRQKQQEEMMKDFSEKLKQDLQDFQPENQDDSQKEQLEKRLEEHEKRLERSEELLEELQRLQEKIDKEDLSERLEKLANEKRNQERNLEQLVELTKRYYVEKKAEKIARELNELGEKQEKLSEEEHSDKSKEAQEEMNERFEKLKEEMEQLHQENDALQKPMDIPKDEENMDNISNEQNEATDKLDEGKPQEAGKNQQKAGQMMKNMAQKMQQQMQSGASETLEEDARMLRQILSNLIVFSFEQEDLLDVFRNLNFGNPVFGQKLVLQNDLKQNFEHIDDSLFALSLRQPMIGDAINEILTETHYNIEKSLERLAENQMPQGLSSQQYVIKGANDLAVLLDDILGNMQMQMQMGEGSGEGMPSSGEGEGDGRGFQLPDIIQQQESLMEQMEEGIEKGEQGEGSESQGEGAQGDGSESGEGSGSDGNQSGQGNNESDANENWSEELFEIYKQQQKLRMELENKLREAGMPGNAQQLLNDMEEVENKLLERGFERNVLQDMRKLQYQLLKLDEAYFQQGQEEERIGETNFNEYENTLRLTEDEIRQYFNTTEILNREALPLRPQYRYRVNNYFNQLND